MNVYFAGSIRGGRQDAEAYLDIITFIKSEGHDVLTEHIGDQKLTAMGEKKASVSAIYRRNLKWMNEADVVIAEVSAPSLGVGYEIAKLESLNTPILCLYRPIKGTSLSAMIAGSPNLTLRSYTTPQEAQAAITKFLKPTR